MLSNDSRATVAWTRQYAKSILVRCLHDRRELLHPLALGNHGDQAIGNGVLFVVHDAHADLIRKWFQFELRCTTGEQAEACRL